MTETHEQDAPRSKKGCFFKIVLSLFCLMLLGVICAAFAAYKMYEHYSDGLPQIAALKNYRPPAVTKVYSDDGRVIGEFFKERRIVIPLSEMPDMLIKAFVAAEDSRFFEHEGIDLKSIIRAALKNYEAGEVVQGGSTITQQVTKVFLLTPEKSYERKIREAILAYRIDQAFSKEEILHLYLNQIYLGHAAYGVEAAAQNYFGKSAKDLSLAECSILAGLPQAPSKYTPYHHMDRAKTRQRYVLDRMITAGFIDKKQADQAFAETLNIQPRKNPYLETVPYYTEYVRQYVEEKYGEEILYTGGLKIYTAVNIEMQAKARAAVQKGLRELDKRHWGYRGPLRHLKPAEVQPFILDLAKTPVTIGLSKGEIVQAVVTEVNSKKKYLEIQMADGKGTIPFSRMKWAGRGTRERRKRVSISKLLTAGDVIWAKRVKQKKGEWKLSLEQRPETQSALLCLQFGTGYVKAMAGGLDFKSSQFNRAVQSRRQPGSAFKPIIYAAAIDKGFTPASEIIDNVFIYKDKHSTWKPKNYDRKFHGPTLLRTALAKSRNLSTVNLLNEIGVDYAVEYAKKLGITSELYPSLSLGLGASGVSLLELSTAYSVFANGGYRVTPVFITKIMDRDGKELEASVFDSEKVIDDSTAYIMTSLMQSVINEGTGTRAKALKRPAAGKTGTTNNLHDAWFMGYTANYITGVWVGYDQEQSLGRGESGGKAAIPIWLDFMKEIHKDVPKKDFNVPPGVVFKRIDTESGLLPVAESKKTRVECFKAGTAPTRYSRSSDSIRERDQLFKDM
jgi:penicillin-binding protein 1A